VSLVSSKNVTQTASAGLEPKLPLSDPDTWVDSYGDYLFKIALLRLRDATRAEDAVQETFLAALKGSKRFSGESSERAWLAGILKNKIYDYFRKASRETSFTDLQFYADEESERFVEQGLHAGSWVQEQAPSEWSSAPGAGIDCEEFWRTYRACSEKLPKNIGAVFTLREIDGVDSKEVCSLLNISESNYWVMLHRARMALRGCLEKNWFARNA
jgi:RNA polymerase sigma-70 factor (ECF subfamily)